MNNAHAVCIGIQFFHSTAWRHTVIWLLLINSFKSTQRVIVAVCMHTACSSTVLSAGRLSSLASSNHHITWICALYVMLWTGSVCACSAGILSALWRGQFLPAGSSAGWTGALEKRAGMWECMSRVWVRGAPCGSGTWREDQRECPLGPDRRGFPRSQRHHVQLADLYLERGLHTYPSLPSQRLLSPQLCAGISVRLTTS